MSSAIQWTRIIPEFINIDFAVTFFLLFCWRMRSLSRFSQSQRFTYINPLGRRGFVYLFIAVNLFQLGYVLFRVTSQPDSNQQSTVQQIAFAIGITLNSCVLVLEIFVMRNQIRKQKPYSPLHRMYWIYLPVITATRMAMQIMSFVESHKSEDDRDLLVEMVVSSILFLDAVALCVYSLFFKRQEIQEFENYALFQFDNLEETLQSQHTLFKLGSMERSMEGFQRLAINVALLDPQRLQLKVYYRKETIGHLNVTLEELERFYQASSIFELHSKINFRKDIPTVRNIKNFFDQLLANWKNYQPFVLDFLQIQPPHRDEIIREVKLLKKQVGEDQPDQGDQNCIYFNIGIWKIVRVTDHFEFFINVSTENGQVRTQLNKRFNQFEEMDRRLREIQVKTLTGAIKLRTPELPDKYYFRMDEQAIDQRMFKLEQYSRRLLNDRIFVKKYEEAKSIVYKFFGLDMAVRPSERPFHISPYVGLSCTKTAISTRMSQKGEPSLVYNFNIRQHSKTIYQISKRYSQVAQFNKQFRRWTHNNQIDCKHISMPPKMITLNQRQKQERHQQLAVYLNQVMAVPHINEFYEFRVLMQRPDRSTTKLIMISRENSRDEFGVIESSDGINSETMSVLIEKLGEDTTKFVT